MDRSVEIRHFHLFCGLGGGAKGFNRASPRVGSMVAKFRCLGGIDVDGASIRDFTRLAGVPGTVMDLFDREQYRAFHGRDPGPGWREATPADIQRAAGGERPHIVFLSAPCKGFSGLLAEGKSKTDKYQALNRLTLRGVFLMLEAWADDPPELVIFENVPRIATRGRHLLDQIVDLLRAYGYAVAETTHDCGEIGGLAQSRKRFLLVARHAEKVPAFLYEPEKRPLRAVGDILGRMPLPGDLRAGPMHRVPALQWKTWVRLAFVEAGSDWRSLNKLAVENGHLRDFLIVPDMHGGVLGVTPWTEHIGAITSRGLPNNGNFAVADPRKEIYSAGYGVNGWGDTTGAVAGESLPSNGRFAVADPRAPEGAAQYQQYGVRSWDESMGAVSGQSAPGGGAYSVADPRLELKHNNCFRIVRFDQAAGTVTGGTGPSAGGQGVADPRPNWEGRHGHLHVSDWEHTSRTVTAGGKGVQGGYLSVADPRPGIQRDRGDHYLTAGHYGVVPFDSPAGAVSAAAGHDNGRWSVADPRMPALADKLICRIRGLDGTWHRPFTTLELAALQSLIDPEDTWVPWQLDGESDQAFRERIGNAVPSEAAEAIAHVMGETLLLAKAGDTFRLSAQPVWVRPVALALSVHEAPRA